MVRCECEDFRRADGGENPIVIPLGLMLLALCFVSLVFYRLKQSNIVACIVIGMCVGGTGLSDSVSRELTAAFIELGIVLVLFMGGLSVDVKGFMNRWKLVLLNGFGQISITLGLFCAVGLSTGITSEAADTFYFGLACTLSSTILGLGALQDRQELDTVHGQVILGLMALQDVVGVVSLLVLASFDPQKAEGPSFGVQIGIMIGKFAATVAILVFLSKYVLAGWFKLFAVSGEMLFVGTVGYALGVAGLAGLADFSPEMGGFFAGVSLSSVPYRLEIEHKVEPIKAFGVVLFFFMLGIDLDMDGESLKAALPWSTFLAVLTVFVTPSIMWALGFVSRFRSRTAFMMGIIINNISEFSLILAQLAHKYEVFDDHQYQVIAFATVITLLFSSMGHVRADQIFAKVGWMLARLDARTNEEEAALEDFEMEDHVVLLGFNETGLEIAEFYRHNNQDVLVIQVDPALHSTLKKGYVQREHRPIINPLPDKEPQYSNASFAFEDWDTNPADLSRRSPELLAGAPRLADAQALPAGRRSLDGMRLRRSLEGDGWSRKPSVEPPAPARPRGEPPPPARARRSLDQVRPRNPEGPSAPPPAGRRSLDSVRKQVVIVDPMFPSPDPRIPAFPEGPPPPVPSPPVARPPGAGQGGAGQGGAGQGGAGQGGRGGALAGVSMPGAWLDPGALLPVEPAEEVQGYAFSRPEAAAGEGARPAGRGAEEGRGKLAGIGFSTRGRGGGGAGGALAGESEAQREAWNAGRTLQQSFRAATVADRGSREGTGTNIVSAYADPESPAVWEHYQLAKAKIVVSCMVGGQASEVYLARRLRKEGVPFLAITNSNQEAKELYEEGCRYVIQQEYLTAKVMTEIFNDEIPKGKERAFDDKRREHKGDLADNHDDDLVRNIHRFL